VAYGAPRSDHKTIADFRKDNGRAIHQVCTWFVALCCTVGLFAQASVVIDGGKQQVQSGQ
jgi:transposase